MLELIAIGLIVLLLPFAGFVIVVALAVFMDWLNG